MKDDSGQKIFKKLSCIDTGENFKQTEQRDSYTAS